MKGSDNLLFISELQRRWIPAGLVIAQPGHFVISEIINPCAAEKRTNEDGVIRSSTMMGHAATTVMH